MKKGTQNILTCSLFVKKKYMIIKITSRKRKVSQKTKLLKVSYCASIRTTEYTLIVMYISIISRVESPSWMGYGSITATRRMQTIV